MPMIEASALSKTFRVYERGDSLRGYLKSFVQREYREVHAVQNLDLEIEEGEMLGYIGPNGAGKSTTVKMLTGILEPTSGAVTVNGITPHEHRKRNAMNIGVVFGQKTQLWWDLPVRESFKLLKDIYEVPDDAYRHRMDEFTAVLQLDEFLDQPVRKLSLGQKMRAELAAAFLHHPPIVYLDEPTIGLDVAVKERIREFIKKMNREKDITVMLTTHDIGDIEDLCDRIVVLDDGRKIYDGALEALVNRFTNRRLIVEMRDDEPLDLSMDGIDAVEQADGHAEIVFNREKLSAADLMQVVLNDYDVVDFQIKEPDIEAVVKKIYNEGLHEP
jgi:ABC-2 type transport system ATP-binding protein